MNKLSAAGPDSIPSMLLNQCCENIAEPLSVCFNKSIDQCSIPDFLKTAAIVPIHKGGSKSDPANYHPVSLTSVIMKIFFFEKKIYFIQKKTNRQKKYIYTLQNLYTHTINIEHIIYMQESSGQPHIDQYRSKLYSLYTSNDRL